MLAQNAMQLFRRLQLGGSSLLKVNREKFEVRNMTQRKKVDPPCEMLSNTKTEFGPLADEDRIFQNLYGRHDWRLKCACKRGDWYRTADLLHLGPDWILNEVKRSGLRGRGGAGFYASIKWEALQKAPGTNKVLVVNCAEGEPGTCKDREILRHEPHKIVEGCLLLGYALGCERCFIYVRNRFYNESCNLQFAVAEAYRYGLLGENSCDAEVKMDIIIQRGDGYLTGEETALVHCLEGKMGRPRRQPPFLFEGGYFGLPSVCVNAETLAVLPTLLRRGARWFTCLGSNNNFGTKIFCITGHVNTPCIVEEEMSIPLRDLIERHGGGVCGGWDNLLAVWPGGLSTNMLDKATIEVVCMDYDSLTAAGSGLGTGGIIVVGCDCDPLLVMQHTIEFYMKHTCKQCTPCRDGGIWLPKIFKSFVTGESVPEMIDFLGIIRDKLDGTAICGLCDAQANAVGSLVEKFRPLIEDRILNFGRSC